MLKIALCDDDAAAREHIGKLLEEYLTEKGLSYRLYPFSGAMALLDAMERERFSALVLDILMPGLTGIQAARELRRFDRNMPILFLTSSPEFAVESYDVNAAYYLLKPFQPEKLCQILDSFRLKEALHARYIEIISDRVPVRVPLHSILYADTFRNAVCLHTDAGPLRSYLTFHKFEDQIRDCHNFLSCYRGCMVNMDRIQEATDDGFLLDNGETVQIRKRGSAAIRKAYLQYLFSSGEGKSLP